MLIPVDGEQYYILNHDAGMAPRIDAIMLSRNQRAGWARGTRFRPIGRARDCIAHARPLDPDPAGRLYHAVPPAGWQSGYAEDCKSSYSGSIPLPASRGIPNYINCLEMPSRSRVAVSR